MNQHRGRQPQQFTGNTFRSGNTYPRNDNSQKPQKQFQKFKGKKGKYDPNANCTHCGKNGHLKLNCYRLIGFPEDFQFTNEKGSHGQIRGNAVVNTEEAEAGSNAHAINQHFTQDQINFLFQNGKELLQAFTQMKVEDKTNFSNASEINANAVAVQFLM
ncbi:hypothetical protein H5410_063565 [Solanum commersonii]|uniref:CCHC-type domain-containing protein n=1 Tax=Solanum commersonii TaxID=4109 RepID=A0A9J5WEP2_SOLCO|nr:hypothetical protein H5410_063565 [Solanum commersonii]